MPDLSNSTPLPPALPPSLYAAPPSGPPEPPPPPPPPPPPVSPAASSNDWERFEGFRQTFLIHFPTEDQVAFQHLARYLFDTALEKPTARPVLGPWTAWEIRAGLAELEFLQGYFRAIMREKEVSSLPKSVEKLCSYAAGAAVGIAEVARTLEQELNRWQRKHPHGSR